jgi:hypothetical protein
MGRGVCVVAVAAAAGLALTAGAGATESTIYPGVGIGKVKLGMTRAQVQRVLGKDATLNDRATYDGKHYVELGWNYSTWSVAFAQTGGSLRVVQVATTLRSQRTPAKIGIGTAWRPLVRAYPHGLCAFGNSIGLPQEGVGGRYGSQLEYLVPHRGGTQTIYMLKLVEDARYTVFEVHVRKPFTALGEFGRDSAFRCRPGWEDTDLPQPL